MIEIDWNVVWDTIKIFLAVFLGWLISQLNNWIKNRKKSKELKDNFLDLYESFRSNELHKIIILIKRIGMKKIEDILSGVGQIWFRPIKKNVKFKISGETTNRDNVKYEEEVLPLPKQSEAINFKTKYDLKVSGHQYIPNQNFQSLVIRFDTKTYMIKLGTVGRTFYIFDNSSNSYSYNGFDHPKNKEILVKFLDYMENRLQEKGIIKKSRELNKKTESWKKKTYNKKIEDIENNY